jgi:hypothetical protein
VVAGALGADEDPEVDRGPFHVCEKAEHICNTHTRRTHSLSGHKSHAKKSKMKYRFSTCTDFWMNNRHTCRCQGGPLGHGRLSQTDGPFSTAQTFQDPRSREQVTMKRVTTPC